MTVRSAGFRVEWRFDQHDCRAKSRRHVLEHVIAADAKPSAGNLHIVGVTVADVPSEPEALQRRLRAKLEKRLPLAHHLHDGAIIEHEPISVLLSSTGCDQSSKAAVPLSAVRTARLR
jgi:hypothetical protein